MTKVYSRQLTKVEPYTLAQPVYSLNLLDHVLSSNETKWFHHYTLTERELHEDHIEYLNLIIIELPKWKKMNKFDLEKSKVRWLMYLSDPNMFSEFLTEKELARYNEISEAIEVLETKNFTPQQIRGYELYLDNIRTYVGTMSEAKREGREEGRLEGKEEGRFELTRDMSLIVDELANNKISIEEISIKYNVNIDFVEKLYAAINKNK
jgi:predicted transposase/invertase (TIGR01784 family)